MSDATAEADVLTELVLEVFRLNGRLLADGDSLVAPIGLTSARWQVLGAMGFRDAPATVAGIARSMGLTRQSVQRLVNELEREGVVRLDLNPSHKRARLVVLTDVGRGLYAAATGLQGPWARGRSQGLKTAELQQALDLLRTLRLRLERDRAPGDQT